jgi:uncharacterized protein (DUF1015 family)
MLFQNFQPQVEVTDDYGVLHRVARVTDPHALRLVIGSMSDKKLIIADGHHRYETALRYRDERRMARACEEDPAFDYLLMLFLEATGEPLTVLPTHRTVRAQGDGGAAIVAGLSRLFDVEPADRATLERFGTEPDQGGRGRFGLWTAHGGFILSARRADFAPFQVAGGDAVRSLDVSLLGIALQELAGIDATAVAAGGLVGYTKSAAEAIALVADPSAATDAAFLLEPTPVASIAAVAADGDVMPQKSTYFYPKALTGLLINPLEW